jgi:hypothetical protein
MTQPEQDVQRLGGGTVDHARGEALTSVRKRLLNGQ